MDSSYSRRLEKAMAYASSNPVPPESAQSMSVAPEMVHTSTMSFRQFVTHMVEPTMAMPTGLLKVAPESEHASVVPAMAHA